MKINSLNTNFTGKLYLKNPEVWTDEMKKAIVSNQSIRKTLETKDIIGDIFVKKENKHPPFDSFHRVGDPIYKVSFSVCDENLSLWEKIKGSVSSFGKKYVVNRRYHSEYTTIERIKKLEIGE